MINSIYIQASKLTPRISQTVAPGQHINIEGVKFEKLNRKPYGKSIIKSLLSADEKERITCYA